MRLYNGRKQISGYVSLDEHEKIARVADRRRVAVADLVSTATLWLANYLESARPAAPPDVEGLLASLGLPALPDPLSLVRGSEGSPQQKQEQQEPAPAAPQRWLYQRREAKAIAGKRTRRTTTK